MCACVRIIYQLFHLSGFPQVVGRLDSVRRRRSARGRCMFSVTKINKAEQRAKDQSRRTWKTCPHPSNLNGWEPSPASSSFSRFASSRVTSSTCTIRVASSISPGTVPASAFTFPPALCGSSKSIRQIAHAARFPSRRTKG